jgi:RNA polymerase sigma-70 factor (ECF subfamily)
MTQTSTETKMLLKDFLADNTEPEPSQIAQNKELCLILTNALMKLDENHRAVIVLRDIEGMSYVQISQVLGVEIGTVKSRICRARRHLRDILEALLP